MLLEDLYNNNLGKCVLFLKNPTEEHFIPMNYHDYANIAFEYISSDLRLFENAPNISFIGRYSIEASSFLFLSIESYINTILKYLSYDNSDNFSEFRGKNLNTRISKINEYIGLKQTDFSKQFPQSKLYEFEEFRNEIFHDRILETEKKFKKTIFSPKPNLPSLVSELQAIIISIDLFNFYRFCISDLDFMPNIRVANHENFCFKRLDELYENVIKPSIIYSLDKHILKTNLSLDISENKCNKLYKPKKFFPSPCIKAVIDKDIDIDLCIMKTNYFSERYFNAIKKDIPPKGTGVVPNYGI